MWLVDLLVAIGVFAYNLPVTPAYAEWDCRTFR